MNEQKNQQINWWRNKWIKELRCLEPGKMSTDCPTSTSVQCTTTQLDQSLLVPGQHLQPGGTCCLLSWLAWPGVGGLQQVDPHRAGECSWHHAQERASAIEARGACLNESSRHRRVVVGIESPKKNKVKTQEATKDEWVKQIREDGWEGLWAWLGFLFAF